MSSHAKCSCEKKLSGAIKRQRINTKKTFFAGGQQYTYMELKASLQNTQQDLKSLALQKSIHHYSSPVHLGSMIESIVTDGLIKLKTIE